MDKNWNHVSSQFHNSQEYLNAKEQILNSLKKHTSQINSVKKTQSEEMKTKYKNFVDQMGNLRGRPLFYPSIQSGLGNGPFMELLDGSVMYDMITGIGVNFLGHSHPIYAQEVIESVGADIMQGNLQPGEEMSALLDALLKRVGKESRLKHGWIMGSGTMVNEIALKCVRQVKHPATKIIAFQDCFTGRSTAMQEITDNPKYRQNQPLYGEVKYIPYYDAKLGLEKSIENTVGKLKEHLNNDPGKFAALMVEIVQGEGGFTSAPTEFFVKLFEAAKSAGLAVWADEVQTFGRTGELFAFQTFGLEKYIDICTVGKLLQSCVVLYTEEYNPQPGLVAGTFSGSTTALRTAKRTVEYLEEEGFLGKDGIIAQRSKYFRKKLDELAEGKCKDLLGERRNVGGMIAFSPFKGEMDDVKATVLKLFDLGVMAFSCGHGPYFVRFLPPLPVMTEAHIDEVCEIISAALHEVSKVKKAS